MSLDEFIARAKVRGRIFQEYSKEERKKIDEFKNVLAESNLTIQDVDHWFTNMLIYAEGRDPHPLVSVMVSPARATQLRDEALQMLDQLTGREKDTPMGRAFDAFLKAGRLREILLSDRETINRIVNIIKQWKTSQERE